MLDIFPEEVSLFAPVTEERQFISFLILKTPKNAKIIASLKLINSSDGILILDEL